MALAALVLRSDFFCPPSRPRCCAACVVLMFSNPTTNLPNYICDSQSILRLTSIRESIPLAPLRRKYLSGKKPQRNAWTKSVPKIRSVISPRHRVSRPQLPSLRGRLLAYFQSGSALARLRLVALATKRPSGRYPLSLSAGLTDRPLPLSVATLELVKIGFRRYLLLTVISYTSGFGCQVFFWVPKHIRPNDFLN